MTFLKYLYFYFFNGPILLFSRSEVEVSSVFRSFPFFKDCHQFYHFELY
jgi:hypothetical protein